MVRGGRDGAHASLTRQLVDAEDLYACQSARVAGLTPTFGVETHEEGVRKRAAVRAVSGANYNMMRVYTCTPVHMPRTVTRSVRCRGA